MLLPIESFEASKLRLYPAPMHPKQHAHIQAINAACLFSGCASLAFRLCIQSDPQGIHQAQTHMRGDSVHANRGELQGLSAIYKSQVSLIRHVTLYFIVILQLLQRFWFLISGEARRVLKCVFTSRSVVLSVKVQCQLRPSQPSSRLVEREVFRIWIR